MGGISIGVGVSIGTNSVLEFGNRVGSRQIRVDDSHQADGLALLRQLVIDAGVVASERTHADHGYVDEVVGCQMPVLSQTEGDLITNGGSRRMELLE